MAEQRDLTYGDQVSIDRIERAADELIRLITRYVPRGAERDAAVGSIRAGCNAAMRGISGG